jgi:hypothetical protein
MILGLQDGNHRLRMYRRDERVRIAHHHGKAGHFLLPGADDSEHGLVGDLERHLALELRRRRDRASPVEMFALRDWQCSSHDRRRRLRLFKPVQQLVSLWRVQRECRFRQSHTLSSLKMTQSS